MHEVLTVSTETPQLPHSNHCERDLPQEIVQKYDQFERLDKSNMAEVYRAKERDSDTSVVIKIIPRKDIERFDQAREEIRLLGRVRGLAFCNQLIEWMETPEAMVIIVEDLSAQGYVSLDQILSERKSFPLHQALCIIEHLWTIVETLWKMRILYRDFKPEHIFIDPTGTIVIIDFGIATDASSPITDWGTPRYFPPERLLRRYNHTPNNIGPESEHFSLTAMLYELLSGQPLFAGDQLVHTIAHWHGSVQQDTQLTLPINLPHSIRKKVFTIIRQHSSDPHYQFLLQRFFEFGLAFQPSKRRDCQPSLHEQLRALISHVSPKDIPHRTRQ